MSDVADEIVAPQRRRAVAVWVLIAVAVLAVGAVGGLLSGLGRWSDRDALDPESPAPAGTRAIAQILDEQGVDVVIARSRDDALRALAETPATLVLPDAPALSDDAVTELAGTAADVVLIDPRARTLRLLLAGASAAGVGDDEPVTPQCALADAERAGQVAPGAMFAAGADVLACYPSGDGHGLLVRDDGDRRIVAVDARGIFTNERLAENGNAALAANLMGRSATLVWYVPSLADTDLPDTQPSLGELTPPWVSPVIVLLLAAGAAAALHAGRRFGPLVRERLPVTVRASETAEGRGRLYAQSRDAVHAADQLRIAVLHRLARLLGLGPAAAASEIADAAADRIGASRAAVRGILIDDLPAGDDDLVALRTRLTDLEGAVRAALRPERKPT